MSKALSEFCIYTIKQGEELEKKARTQKPATFSERKAWVTGHKLWLKAKDAATAMPVLLGDATDCSRMQYWGLLTDIRLDGEETLFTVDQVRPLVGKHSPQELTLRKTGKPIRPNFIRPYAICRTPDFLT